MNDDVGRSCDETRRGSFPPMAQQVQSANIKADEGLSLTYSTADALRGRIVQDWKECGAYARLESCERSTFNGLCAKIDIRHLTHEGEPVVYASLKDIWTAAGVGESTVRKGKNGLIAKGYVKLNSLGGSRESSIYTIRFASRALGRVETMPDSIEEKLRAAIGSPPNNCDKLRGVNSEPPGAHFKPGGVLNARHPGSECAPPGAHFDRGRGVDSEPPGAHCAPPGSECAPPPAENPRFPSENRDADAGACTGTGTATFPTSTCTRESADEEEEYSGFEAWLRRVPGKTLPGRKDPEPFDFTPAIQALVRKHRPEVLHAIWFEVTYSKAGKKPNPNLAGLAVRLLQNPNHPEKGLGQKARDYGKSKVYVPKDRPKQYTGMSIADVLAQHAAATPPPAAQPAEPVRTPPPPPAESVEERAWRRQREMPEPELEALYGRVLREFPRSDPLARLHAEKQPKRSNDAIHRLIVAQEEPAGARP